MHDAPQQTQSNRAASNNTKSNASFQAPTQRPNTQRGPSYYFQNGKTCPFADNCKFAHIAESQSSNTPLDVAQNSPSKQHEGYYDVYYSTDRKTIEEMSKYTWGYTHRRNPPATWRNSQSNASAYILWVAKEPNSQLNCNADGTLKSNTDKNRWQNAYCSIGISIGLTMRAAAKMGFDTGCNKSHNDLNGDDYWPKKLGILDDIKAGTQEI